MRSLSRRLLTLFLGYVYFNCDSDHFRKDNVKFDKNYSLFSLAILLLTLSGCSSSNVVAIQPSPTSPTAVYPTATLTPEQRPSATSSPIPTMTSTATVTPQPTQTATSSPTPTPEPAELKFVVLISIDGLRPDALEIADTPTLDALIAAGAYSPTTQAVLPTVTLINHASMLGGMSPDKHGISWNVLDPEAGKINGPTLFSIAHEAGLTSTMVIGKPKLDHIVLPESVDSFIHPGYTDRQVVNQSLEIIKIGLPDILFIHLPDVDSEGHATGWMMPGQLQTITLTDGLIGEIVNALQKQDVLKNTLLIITSDHGGSGLSHGSASAEDVTIPWLAIGPGVPAGERIERDIVVYDTAATILYALGLPIPDVWDGQAVDEIFDQIRE